MYMKTLFCYYNGQNYPVQSELSGRLCNNNSDCKPFQAKAAVTEEQPDSREPSRKEGLKFAINSLKQNLEHNMHSIPEVDRKHCPERNSPLLQKNSCLSCPSDRLIYMADAEMQNMGRRRCLLCDLLLNHQSSLLHLVVLRIQTQNPAHQHEEDLSHKCSQNPKLSSNDNSRISCCDASSTLFMVIYEIITYELKGSVQ